MRLLILAAMSVAGASLVEAQATARLSGTPRTHPAEFTTVTGFRVLDDDRVVVSDIREQSLQLLDFRDGSAREVGRRGAGPGEWANPSTLFTMPGDSTLMEDPGNGRFLVILPDGRPGPTFRLTDESLASVAGLAGVDPTGRLFLLRTVPPANPGRGAAGTGVVEVYRHDRRSGRSERIAQYAEPAGEVSAARILPGGMLQLATNLPLAASDAVAAVPNGELAIIRANPYRVDRIGRDGALRQGQPAEAPRIRVTQAEKDAFVRGQVRPGGIIVSGGPNAAAAAGGARERPRTPQFTGDVESLFSPDMTWPEFKPPFVGRPVVGAPSGDLWVMRSRAHDDPHPVYDVFGSDGRVRMRVQLAPRSRVVGIGRTVVFVARTDEDDLVHLERYALPR